MDNIPKLKLLTGPLADIFCIIQNELKKKNSQLKKIYKVSAVTAPRDQSCSAAAPSSATLYSDTVTYTDC